MIVMQNKPKNAREWLIRITDQINIFNNWKEQENLVEHLLVNDVVPVVRCKDCERRSKDADLNDTIYCPYLKTTMPKDAFCSYGERKDSNG